MKVFAGERNDDSVIECTEVDLMCDKSELDELIEVLIQFRDEINIYIQNNKSKSELGITHMHYQDNVTSWREEDPDLVVYVDLDK